MGIIPVPPDHGANCLTCFPAGQSPELMKLFFGGIQKADWPGLPNPYQGYYDATNAGNPACHWGGGNPAALHWNLSWGPAQSTIALTWGVVTGYFFGIVAQPCNRYFSSNYIEGPGVPYWGGFAYAATPAEMAAWIETALPVVGPDPRMELFPMEGNQIVIRFASKIDGTNIKIKFDTTAL